MRVAGGDDSGCDACGGLQWSVQSRLCCVEGWLPCCSPLHCTACFVSMAVQCAGLSCTTDMQQRCCVRRLVLIYVYLNPL